MSFGQFGVPRPSGLTEQQYLFTNEYPVYAASGIERTMYWLDRIAEQHNWNTKYSSNPLIGSSPSGFFWKRHNGQDLERFIPKDSGIYELEGYPVSSQSFWENYRNIINFVGHKTLKRYDISGGQVGSLVGGTNSSGNMWHGHKWITYGNYKLVPYSQSFTLGDPTQDSFVDFNNSSDTKYIGRHGQISKSDFTQYIAPSLNENNSLGSLFYGYRGGYCTATAALSGYNQMDNDWKVIEPYQDYGASLIGDIRTALSGCNSWTYVLGGLGGSVPVLSYASCLSHYIIAPTLTRTTPSLPANSVMVDIFGMAPATMSQIFNATSTGGGPTVGIGGGTGGGLDILTYSYDGLGNVTSITITDRKDRVIKYTLERFNVTGEYAEAFGGILIPLNRKNIDITDITASGDINHYIRSFTGLTPSDSLDITVQRQIYGANSEVKYSRNAFIADTFDLSITSVGDQLSGGITSNLIFTAASSLISSFPSIFTPINGTSSLIYGYVDYSGYYYSNDVMSLVRAKIDANQYSIISTFSNKGISFPNSEYLNQGEGTSIAFSAASGISLNNSCGLFHSQIPRSRLPGPINPRTFIDKLGSFQSYVDLEPSGNIMFVCVIPPSSVSPASIEYPEMQLLSKQYLHSDSISVNLDNYRPSVAWPRVNNLTFSYSSSNYSAYMRPQDDGAAANLDGGPVAHVNTRLHNVAKWGIKSKYYYETVSPGASSILAQDTSYGALKSGDKVPINCGFFNIYSDTNIWDAP